MLELGFGLKFKDLYNLEGLKGINNLWLSWLAKNSEDLKQEYLSQLSSTLSAKEESLAIIKFARYLEDFICELFPIKSQVIELAKQHSDLAPLYKCKRLFVQRVASKRWKDEDISKLEEAKQILINSEVNFVNELSFANKYFEAEQTQNQSLIEAMTIYAGFATNMPEGKALHHEGVLFKNPNKIDFQNLINEVRNSNGGIISNEVHNRSGFDFTDKGVSLEYALDQANYCIHCHNQERDSCSHGIKDKATDTFKTNELGVTLNGCPLEEKISEMNFLKTEGIIIGSVATAIIDNPMLAATGHRICNDCMKSCIYQKQDPVNIPAVETKVLNDVLNLDYGFEIYSLLTRWNPLNFKQPLPKESTQYKVLVAGLGPAGFTLAHHLLNSGINVVGIDGLKIEPLPTNLSGINELGIREEFKPIKRIDEVFEPLGSRVPQGFGGVVEYGITVRYQKNNLTLIRLLLERRENFRMYGGVRFGSNVTYEDVKSLGFDHVAMAFGAGKPNLVEAKNIMAKGCRTASDFLMSLQLTGAALEKSFANLQIRLPVLVIGGGLTAVDAATESMAYYAVQVEKFLKNYESLGDSIFDGLSSEDLEIAHEFLDHAKKLRAHPEKKTELLQSFGGSHIVYRRTMKESPAYRLNHEEIVHGLQEGISFIENITPLEIELDQYNSVKSLVHKSGKIAARTILIAAGTQPNTVIAEEDADNFVLDGKYFKAVEISGEKVTPERVAKPKIPQVIHKISDLTVSFFGDLHPSFVGNVVKAMASAKQGYPKILEVLAKSNPRKNSKTEFFKELDSELLATVKEVIRLTPNIVEVIIHSKLAARNFKPGQFYRLQNYHKYASHNKSQPILMEGLALTGAWSDKEKGLISVIVLEMGGSSNFCDKLQPNEPVVLMGPTGAPTEIPSGKKVMLVGGGLGNAVLFSIGKALLQAGSEVLYFAGYKKEQDRYKIEEIEAASSVIVWCCDEAELSKNRPQDFSFKGNIVEAIKAYGEGILGESSIKTKDIDHMIVIGSDRMMGAVAHARHNSLSHLFKNNHIAVGSINSPMQCMMKEICGQCIQRHYNPETCEESYVFSCSNQDQDLDLVDFANLNQRLNLNSLQEKVCAKVISKAIQ